MVSHRLSPEPLSGAALAPRQGLHFSKLTSLPPGARITLYFVGFSALLLVVLVGWIVADRYADALRRAEINAKASAQVVDANISLLMQTARQSLRRIDAAVGDSLVTATPAGISDLNTSVEELPSGVVAFVLDQTGEVRFSSAPMPGPLNGADRSYFQAVKGGKPFAISELLTSRASGQQVFTVAKRMERAGRFVGAAIISIPANYMDRFREPLALGPDSTVGLLRDDGMLVSRSPVPPEALNLANYVLFTTYLKQAPTGTYEATSPTDGKQRIVAYRKIEALQLVAIASIARSEAFVDFNASLVTLVLVVVPGLLVLGALGARAMRAQVQLAAALLENQLLFKEIHHRVKNNLQQVLALINMQPVAAELKQETARKIGAMAALHEHIYRRDAYGEVDVAEFFPGLVQAIGSSFAEPMAVEGEYDHLTIRRDDALPLALITAEVIANAAKHAFAGVSERRVSIAVRRVSDDKARLTIHDNGRGYGGEATGSGTGSRLIKALCRQLEGLYWYEIDGGTKFSLEFPVQKGPHHSNA